MLNNKGQAFSVFQLLIAAVVALAILGLLMSVMGMIDFSSNTNPAEVAKNLLKDAQNNAYNPYTGEGVFSNKDVISRAALATDLQTGSEKIFLYIVGDELSGFDNSSETMITYTGTEKKVNLLAICGTDVDSLEEVVDGILSQAGESNPGLDGDGFSCHLIVYPYAG